jgi:LPXTG-site transpeptidase (sortase) family protein
MVMGLVLLSLAGVYYAAAYLAARNPGRLVYQTDLGAEETSQATLLPAMQPDKDKAGASGDLAAPAPEAQALYPGASLAARLWADPRGTLDLGSSAVPTGFTPLRTMGEPVVTGASKPAAKLIIPVVGIDARVEELRVLDLQDSRAYETPKHVVGHIPDTPNPGAPGNGWYFGHLESPILGEGNVFARLLEVPDLLREGEDVYIITEAEDQQYLYRVTGTDLVHEDDLRVYGSDDSRVTLVTCFPRLRYDQRLLVTAKLVGFKGASQANE